MKHLQLLFVLCLLQFYAYSQKDSLLKNTLHFQTSTSSYLSFTGFSIAQEFELEYYGLGITVAPKLAAIQSNALPKGPWGLIFGTKYNIAKSKNWQSFVFMNYQLLWYATQQANINTGKTTIPAEEKKNYVHEYFFGYGLRYHFNKKVFIENKLAIGRFTEALYDFDISNRVLYSGYNVFFNLGIGYQFR